jgi:hypothetical protein
MSLFPSWLLSPLLLILLWLYGPLFCLGCSFSFLILYKVGRTPWTGGQPVARPLPTHRTTQTQKSTQTSMPRVAFKPKIPFFEPEKTVHALECGATVIGRFAITSLKTLATKNYALGVVQLR